MTTVRHLRRNSAPSLDGMTDSGYFEFCPKLSVGPLDSPSPVACSPQPSPSVSTQAERTRQHRLNAAQEQRMYYDSCQRLLGHISTVMGMCRDLQRANRGQFPVRFPSTGARAPERSLTLPLLPTEAKASPILDAVRQAPVDFSKELSVLGLDLKMGRASTDVMTSLDGQAVTNLFDDRLEQCLRHLDNLHTRVSDTSSKVLVTGDLNSGKSTFVNALLKRELLPTDQQPCTSMFCEVLDAMLNDGVEQVHAIPNVENYNRLDPSTYHVIELRHMYKVLLDESDNYKMLKIYATDARSAEDSLLHNGVVDIALIDSPGLNTDSVKTTAVFARQEEIDVVVFVVSAENHFTLSGKEFLWNATNEKTHIFIVVNRFDSIRDKDRCKRLILEQIRQLSPATYADADDLVHFVSSGNVDLEPCSHRLDAPEFARLEQRLRAFVLENRTKSKLSPAKNYLVNLLMDIGVLSEANKAMASDRHAEATAELDKDSPEYEKLLHVRKQLLNQVEKVAEHTIAGIQTRAQRDLTRAVDNISTTVDQIQYPGLLLLWQYAQDIADSMGEVLLKQSRQLEGIARHDTSACIDKMHELSQETLGDFPISANMDKMFLKNRDRCVLINVELTDFFDLALDDKLSGCALSLGAVAMVGSRLMGWKDAVSSVWNISNAVGSRSIQKLVLPIVSVAGVGLAIYVVSDMPHAVRRKLIRKFKEAVQETGYVDAQSRRLARESRKVLKVEGFEIQNQLVRAIEDKEAKRSAMESAAHHAEEAMHYFDGLRTQATMLMDKIHAIAIEHDLKPKYI